MYYPFILCVFSFLYAQFAFSTEGENSRNFHRVRALADKIATCQAALDTSLDGAKYLGLKVLLETANRDIGGPLVPKTTLRLLRFLFGDESQTRPTPTSSTPISLHLAVTYHLLDPSSLDEKFVSGLTDLITQTSRGLFKITADRTTTISKQNIFQSSSKTIIFSLTIVRTPQVNVCEATEQAIDRCAETAKIESRALTNQAMISLIYRIILNKQIEIVDLAGPYTKGSVQLISIPTSSALSDQTSEILSTDDLLILLELYAQGFYIPQIDALQLSQLLREQSLGSDLHEVLGRYMKNCVTQGWASYFEIKYKETLGCFSGSIF